MVVVLLDKGPTAQSGRKVGSLSGLGQRFERSLVGEAVISGLVMVVILIGVVWNLPDSDIKKSLTPNLRPIAAATGLQQRWQMYAPEPVSGLETLNVRVRMADGSDRNWTWHRGDLVVGPFSWYHWQKLKEQAVREPVSRAGIARWVVRELTTPSERPVSVEMLLRSEFLPAPGKDGPMRVKVETLYAEKLGGRP
jgi:hypothetical protein